MLDASPWNGFSFFFFFFSLYTNESSVWGSGTELFWYPRLGSSLARLLITFFYGYQQCSYCDWRPFVGDTVVKKSLGKYLDCFASSFFPTPPVFRTWRTVPISMVSASGSEEWLPKLLLIFLVFRKRKAVLNWSQAVAMWGLTLDKESSKCSPAFWSERARCVGTVLRLLCLRWASPRRC